MASLALAKFGKCICGLNLSWHRSSDNRQLTCLGARHAYETFQAGRRAGQAVAVKRHDLNLPSDPHAGEV